MLDEDRWSRLLFHVLAELEIGTDEAPVEIERAAVLIYADIYRRLNHLEGD